ncbi:ActS/PrrB/RegB family redox-sensitive histidine kinase [Rhizobium halophytocola]|uniref:histidine kinase n=1 Tax=Rhizobium halophytocola TaxID=735519 RepID=A0ABS4E1I0_9HYPH|nr:ActS/PrrB/RegB family redox-sensitive histidine kinase [Rhizobium halophytocola]MBP1851799.1 two-component system sensor histidine kinase RegB [Rhizobium halophytocola]
MINRLKANFDGRFDEASRRLRLETLVRLRWLAVAGQTLTVLVVGLWFQFSLPLFACLALIGGLAAANLVLTLAFPSTHRLSPLSASLLLGFDLLQLAALLFITGGLANPFAPLLCVAVIISFSSQPLNYSLILMGLAAIVVSAQFFTPFPLPWYGDQHLVEQPVMSVATWTSVISMMGFAAFYAYRVSEEASLLSDALAATELVLQREKHLSQLDGLAAAAAHELGTPLATISVVAREMERELGNDERFGEDVHLLRSQSERCRDILRRLTSLPSESEQHMRTLPLSSMIEEVVAPHREFGITIDLVEQRGKGPEPVLERSPGIQFGLGNLVENAVDYARDKVTLTVGYTASLVTIMLEDDGNGYSQDILARIGEPYMTSRSRAESAGGLGLGLFIAKTLLERSGAVLRFENRGDGGGARVVITWPRTRIETISAARD